MQKHPLCIRADGNAMIGLGHIHRMIALAGYIKDFFDITFYIFNADNIVTGLIEENGFFLQDLQGVSEEKVELFIEQIPKEAIVVLDGYKFGTDYQKTVKANGNKVVAIDDLNEWENEADVVINHAFSGSKDQYKLAKNTRFYGGLKYSIIKSRILETTHANIKISNRHVLVCIGGTDPGNYSEKIVHELLNHTTKKISLLTYPLNPKFENLQNLALHNPYRLQLFHSLNTDQVIQLIQDNDIAILQPSNIALEAAALGIYISLVQTADNQKFILETLLKANCASLMNQANIIESINEITVDQINDQIKQQNKLIDKKSPQRILEIMNSLLLEYREADLQDAEIIYKWNTDPVTRMNSYNQSEIEYNNHVKWFSAKLQDKHSCFLIFTYNSIPAGCIRIDSKENENIIGITIAPEMRGRKLSALILKQSAEYFFRVFLKEEITAYIKKDNRTSLKSFEKAGYTIQDAGQYFGAESYKLIKKKDEHI